MAVTVESLQKDYGYNTDDTWQPEIAHMCIVAAKEYLSNAGCPERDSCLYDLAVCMLALNWYQNRGVTLVGAIRGEVQKGLDAIIPQLQYTPRTGGGPGG